jgi:hypothetical protein
VDVDEVDDVEMEVGDEVASKGGSMDGSDRQTGRWPNRSHCRGLKATASAGTRTRTDWGTTGAKEKEARRRPTSQTLQLALAVTMMVAAAVVAMAAGRVLDCEP